MRYLTVQEVLEINAEVMGGSHALRDPGLLESAVARPQASAFGADAYPDLASKAAALLHSLISNHAFVDGNKRTAVLSTLVFLDLNGYVVRWDQHEALDFVLQLAYPSDRVGAGSHLSAHEDASEGYLTILPFHMVIFHLSTSICV